MGAIKSPETVKIIVGLISKRKDVFDKVKPRLIKRLGSIDLESAILIFNHTEYYKNEMGEGLKRKFFSFSKIVLPEKLERIKKFTNSIEADFSKEGKRTVNIDPGYVEAGKLVLLSTKNYTHRIYLGGGIYAESTLYFQNGTFRSWPWTYPDYKTQEYIEFFNRVRKTK